ncbi:WD repeat-containing protein 2 [Pseudovirgaria hyperparasitica]|uniref:WD repeat-containing protein 2 n=1 Tax=Pseudovirgaria hyperparasitica TaxID=470096 RepID=A0A6A6WBW9_9PEZI|nr:WD repeat-containing protein 2 [Pseudovirgaria hyperparasitica]KAF2760075.1 WD repeat-containing protein 2 [Pseudovirgaria hyperparasitica]
MSLKSEAIWAPSPTTTRGQPTILSADKKGERIAYASGKSIFVRSIENPAECRQYTQHTATTTVARFAPSGFYIASGDASGSVRVWDCVGEGVTKGEYHIVNGPINDIAWDGDSQRIIAVGSGKERFGHCITWDSGNTVGQISGHSAQINTVSIRQQRPLRAVTGGDDTSLVFYHGAPFKFNTSMGSQHNRFVFGAAFSPDGVVFVSVGADKKIWLFDGKTGEPKNQIGEGVHTGSIFGVSWAQDSKRFVTASADQTVRIWDAEAGKVLQTWRLGGEGVSIPHQQLGVVWTAARGNTLIISVDLEGNLNYLVEGQPEPEKIIHGHQKNITAAGVNKSTLVTGSFEGRVRAWDVKTGLAHKVEGDGHSNYVSGFAAADINGESQLQSIGWDDTLRSLSLEAKTFTGTTIPTDGQPRSVAVSGATTLVATSNGIQLFIDGEPSSMTKTSYTPTCIAASGSTVAVGGDEKVYIYTLSSPSSLQPTGQELRPATAAVTALSFSQSGTNLAAGTGSGKIVVYTASGDWAVATDRWSAHSGRVTCIAWAKDGDAAVSGSLDTNVFAWSLREPAKRVKAPNAHKDGVTGVAWVDGRVLSTGSDATVKVWTLP